MRAQIGMSDGQPPLGGIAKEWAEDREGWSWLGSRIGYCHVDGTKIHFQDFENGTIIGAFPLNQNGTGFQVFVLFNDLKWTSRQSAEEHPNCGSD